MTKIVNFYTKKHCPLCEEAKNLLLIFQDNYSFKLEEIDIYSDEELLEKYQISIPVARIDGEELDGSQMDYVQMEDFLERYIPKK